MEIVANRVSTEPSSATILDPRRCQFLFGAGSTWSPRRSKTGSEAKPNPSPYPILRTDALLFRRDNTTVPGPKWELPKRHHSKISRR